MDKKEKELISDLSVSRQQGGMLEMMRTGKYPDYIHFHSGHYRQSWKHKVHSTNQNGKLTKSGQILFEYKISDSNVWVKIPGSDLWHTMDVETIMYD
jgi:hypothetical protein